MIGRKIGACIAAVLLTVGLGEAVASAQDIGAEQPYNAAVAGDESNKAVAGDESNMAAASSESNMAAASDSGDAAVASDSGNAVAMSDEGDADGPADPDDTDEPKLNGIVTDPTGETENRYYYVDGERMYVTDVLKVEGIWYNLVAGMVTGCTVAENENGWWYIGEDGTVDFSYTGVSEYKNSYGWWYIKDGAVNFDYTGFGKNSKGSWYVTNGKVTFSDNDIIKDSKGSIGDKGTWYYVVGSKVQSSYTGVANHKNAYGWWYIKDGKVDKSYTGFAENKKGSWYVSGGKVTLKTNSVIKDTKGAIGDKGVWYYVVGSKVQSSYTGVANYKNSYGWWYIKDGKVDKSYTGYAKNKKGSWYVSGGKVTLKTNSVIKDTKGAIGDKGTWYYVVGSKVQSSYTGVANYKNSYGWWYIKDGKVDKSYTGYAKNEKGRWYVSGGKVTLKTNSVIKDTKGAIGDKGTWYYVVGSKVQSSYTGVANYKNSYGWWYIKNGKVDFSYNGIAKNKKGTWYVTKGKVRLDYTGLSDYKYDSSYRYIKKGALYTGYTGLAKNSSGWWYVTGGKTDSSYSGVCTNSSGAWYVKNGKVDFSYSGYVTWKGDSHKVTNGKVSGISVSGTMANKAKSLSSSTDWLVLVDVSACKVGIFYGSKGSWTAMKYYTCTPGKSSTPTVRGTYKVYDKGLAFGDGTYTCWYYTKFYGEYMLHSVLYYPGSKTSIKDGRLGQHLSHGCVRLAIENAKWIYDNIPVGTKVVTY